jgi:hypothetical protein
VRAQSHPRRARDARDPARADPRFLDVVAEAQTGAGRPLAPAWRARLAREWAYLKMVESRLRTLKAERAAHRRGP